MTFPFNHRIFCNLSGLPIGELGMITTAGAIPYLSHWQKMAAYHPVFSLSEFNLFKFTKGEWDRLNKAAADDEISEAEANILKVSWLACLHALGDKESDKPVIKQDEPALPALHIVQSTLNKVLALAYWRYYLESNRFRFPTYHICKLNNNLDFKNVGDYLDLCFDLKDSYETKINEIEEKEKVRAAAAALEALSREWITPVSRKVLWAWVRSNLPEKYAADKVGWMHTLFMGGGTAIVEFQEEDLELLEEIIISECPAGTGIMKAVRERIAFIWKTWKNHHAAFDIDIADYAKNQGILVNGLQVQHPDPGAEPQMAQFAGAKAKYYVAHAKWSVAKAAWEKQNSQSNDPLINKMLGEI